MPFDIAWMKFGVAEERVNGYTGRAAASCRLNPVKASKQREPDDLHMTIKAHILSVDVEKSTRY
jgi:hypothetical protein